MGRHELLGVQPVQATWEGGKGCLGRWEREDSCWWEGEKEKVERGGGGRPPHVAAAELRCSSSWLGLSGASLATPRHISWRRGCQPPAGKGGRVGWSWGGNGIQISTNVRTSSHSAQAPKHCCSGGKGAHGATMSTVKKTNIVNIEA